MTALTLPAGRFRGLRLVGDVHGESAAFAAILDDARRDGRFVVQMGDLVDYGPDSPGVLRLALAMVERGEGLWLRGNHDDKFARWLAGRAVSVTGPLERTIAQLDAASDRDDLTARFRVAYDQAPFWLTWPGVLAVHGAFHPAMPELETPANAASRRDRDRLRALALFAETDGTQDAEGLPTRTHGWVDAIPAGLTVFVGHDIRATTAPLDVTGALGGLAIFLDTGAGKGGHLSCRDLPPPG